jgi:hypothetical protein
MVGSGVSLGKANVGHLILSALTFYIYKILTRLPEPFGAELGWRGWMPFLPRPVDIPAVKTFSGLFVF